MQYCIGLLIVYSKRLADAMKTYSITRAGFWLEILAYVIMVYNRPPAGGKS